MLPIRNNDGLYSLLCIFLLVISGWCVKVNAGAPQNDPVKLLQFIADNMITSLKANHANLKSNPQIVYSLANRYIVPYIDIAEMSRRVLPPAIWNGATPSEQAQFKTAFIKTLIRTYASALTAYEDQTIQFFPIRGGLADKQTVDVASEITSKSGSSPSIRMNYRLIKNGAVWKLIDLSVEGVDMLESFRAQFADILSRGNMSQLLQKMRTRSNVS